MSTVMQSQSRPAADPLIIAGVEYQSRLLVGTGKYKDLEETRTATEASGAEIVTVAIRRTNIGQRPGEPNLLDVISPERYTLLPNTAGCYTADDAVRTCRLARELLDGHELVKLEVLGDEKTLFPDILETIKATEILVREGFQIMVYTNDDPIIAKRFEDMGCIAVMPLAAPIGSGLGIRNPYNILTIVENATVPILVDAGVGTASDAAIAMELGCDGVLMNTAIAGANDPVLMAAAMKKAIEAGREAFRAGRIPRKRFASASSPIDGTFF
jgi:thiazole synthase